MQQPSYPPGICLVAGIFVTLSQHFADGKRILTLAQKRNLFSGHIGQSLFKPLGGFRIFPVILRQPHISQPLIFIAKRMHNRFPRFIEISDIADLFVYGSDSLQRIYLFRFIACNIHSLAVTADSLAQRVVLFGRILIGFGHPGIAEVIVCPVHYLVALNAVVSTAQTGRSAEVDHLAERTDFHVRISAFGRLVKGAPVNAENVAPSAAPPEKVKTLSEHLGSPGLIRIFSVFGNAAGNNAVILTVQIIHFMYFAFRTNAAFVFFNALALAESAEHLFIMIDLFQIFGQLKQIFRYGTDFAAHRVRRTVHTDTLFQIFLGLLYLHFQIS